MKKMGKPRDLFFDRQTRRRLTEKFVHVFLLGAEKHNFAHAALSIFENGFEVIERMDT
jgi:hypothetical protein